MENSDNKKQLLDNWNEEKFLTHSRAILPAFKEGDVWWCKIGENIGIEINGKHKYSLRPVYILKKFDSMGALVIPLTSQKKTGSWYCSFLLKNRRQYAVFAQVRTISSLRLCRKLGVPSKDIQKRIKAKFFNFLS